MSKHDEWFDRRASRAGPPDRKVRFAKAGRALAQARQRNRIVEDGGVACPVLVEGRKDRLALLALGFSGPIEQVNRGWDRSRLVAYLHSEYGTRNSHDRGPVLILMMDWDRTGGRLQRELGRRLRALDMQVEEQTRKVLLQALKPEGRTVETLTPHAEELLTHMALHDL